MDILIRDAKEKRERLLAEIDTLEKEIQDTNLKETIEKNDNILKNVLQQHQEYIKEKKTRKLRRDANDYDTGRIFTFARKFDNSNTDISTNRISLAAHSVPNIATSDTDLSSCSSITSGEAGSSLEEQRGLKGARLPARASENAEKEGRRAVDEEESVEEAGVWGRELGRQKRPPVKSQDTSEGEDVSGTLTVAQEAYREDSSYGKRGTARCVHKLV
ncbi:hypothetical protein NDU88_008232 [Pleurodeles waltl]|uniref:Uncharacterized protein n=1 Tax=Pleurodeles waltl TaxID=8319 RepID=A0AAV7N4D4_PLEWA|nr:hypothetical protein NDU88_008232 [Pleurodeles waltl]